MTTAQQHPAHALKRLPGVDTSLYLVTDTAMCKAAGRTVAETVKEAIRGGVGIVQVRDKDLSDAEFQALATDVLYAVSWVRDELNMIEPIPVFLNDRVEVAQRLLDHGHQVHVHVGQSDTPVAKVREMIGADPLIGLSAQTPEHYAAAQEAGGVDLFGTGPVWPTQTKDVQRDALGVQKFTELAAQTPTPVFAIGGIKGHNAQELRTAGAAGICVVSDICTAPDPTEAARALYRAYTGLEPDIDA